MIDRVFGFEFARDTYRLLQFFRDLAGRLLDRLTIRQQIAGFSACLCACLVLIAIVSASSIAKSQALRDARARERALAESMAFRLDQQMFERFRQLQAVASLDEFRTLWKGDSVRLQSMLDHLQNSLPIYAWLGVADVNGTVRAATRGMLRGKSVAARPWFKDGASAPAVENVHEATLLNELLNGNGRSSPFRFVDIAMPLRDETGAQAGVLGAHLSWSWAEDARRTVLEQQDPEQRMDIVVYAADGSVLLGAPGTKPLSIDTLAQLNDQRGAELMIADSDGEHLASVTKTVGLREYPGLGWIVMAREPLAVALAPVDRLGLWIFAIGAILSLVGVAAAWVIAGNLARPFAALREDLDLVWRDPARVNVARQKGSSDALALSTAVRSLLRRVSAAETTVEDSVRKAEEARIESDRFKQVAEELAEINAKRALTIESDLEKFRTLAETDALTELLNRRAFLPIADDTFDIFRRHARPFAILMIDVDHFKLINDRFGHASGDEVLRSISAVLQSEVRSTDKAARLGGEEFTILLRESDADEARRLAERVRAAVEHTIVVHSFYTIRATVSIGVTMARTADRDVQDVIQRADAALYAAKQSGRNRVAVDEVRLSDAA